MSGVISTIISPCGRYSLTWHASGSTSVIALLRDIGRQQDYAMTHPMEARELFVPVQPEEFNVWIPMHLAAATDPLVNAALLKDFAEFLEG